MRIREVLRQRWECGLSERTVLWTLACDTYFCVFCGMGKPIIRRIEVGAWCRSAPTPRSSRFWFERLGLPKTLNAFPSPLNPPHILSLHNDPRLAAVVLK